MKVSQNVNLTSASLTVFILLNRNHKSYEASEAKKQWIKDYPDDGQNIKGNVFIEIWFISHKESLVFYKAFDFVHVWFGPCVVWG